MRRWGRWAEATEILGWSEIAKGLMGSVVVVAVGEGVNERLECVDPVGELVGGIELVSPTRLGALDAAIEVGALGRQDDEFEALDAAMVLEDGHKLRSAVDLDAFDLEGGTDDELVEQDPCGPGGGGARDMADRPFGNRIVRR
jgi:hypothetical protein